MLNANISPLTAEFLRGRGYDVFCVLEEGLGEVTDQEVVTMAKERGRVIVTSDLDFGEIFYRREKGKIGVVILRLHQQTIESINKALENFLGNDLDWVVLAKKLVVVTETDYRVAQV